MEVLVQRTVGNRVGSGAPIAEAGGTQVSGCEDAGLPVIVLADLAHGRQCLQVLVGLPRVDEVQ